MERLTQDNFDYCLEMCDSEYMHKCPFYKDERESKCHTAAMYYKLRAYEDTGLSPRQITMAMDTLKLCDSIGAMRMNEILDAERDGRLVVLPCKVGDKLFQLFHGYIDPITVMRVRPYIMTDLVSFFPEDFGKTVFLTREEAEKAMKGVSEDANN